MKTLNEAVAINAILYILNQLGGQCDIHKISKVLYFADQQHLALYGRSITGDDYIAMQYGPVPSHIYDIFKAVRGASYFSNFAEKFAVYFRCIDHKSIGANKQPDLDYLSESDIECLDYALQKCEGKSFFDLTSMSHENAWNKANANSEIAVEDILRDAGSTEEYISYISNKLKVESCTFA